MKSTIIHIAKQAIQQNTKYGTNKPPVIVRRKGKSQRCQQAVIRDAQGNEVARIVHSAHEPLSCGARVWIETALEVELIEPECKDV